MPSEHTRQAPKLKRQIYKYQSETHSSRLTNEALSYYTIRIQNSNEIVKDLKVFNLYHSQKMEFLKHHKLTNKHKHKVRRKRKVTSRSRMHSKKERHEGLFKTAAHLAN